MLTASRCFRCYAFPAAAVAILLTGEPRCGAQAVIDVQVDRPLAELSPVLYGLFFEDINYSADGGLYAELVQNRSFEYYPVTGWDRRSERLRPLTAWSKVERDGGEVRLAVASDAPLNSNNTKYLSMTLKGGGVAGVENAGFGGVRIKKGGRYDFSVYAKWSGDGSAPVTVTIQSADGGVLASGEIPSVETEWKKYELTLTATATDPSASLAVTTTGGGKLMLDMVSLFPQDTFKGRKNGLRADLAQALADLKPGFLRFPGGCIAHGQGLDNAYRWKDTVGDVAQRKPNWNLWGYHQTYGLGYFEYMQLCEDIGATPLPVVPLGVSCGFRQPFEFEPMENLHEWIEDALDLIEFANGPADSEWGRVRAEMGHPEPFNLEYVCLGNEEHDTPGCRERFPYFVEAVRRAHPEIKIIGTSGLGPEIPLYDLMTRERVYSSDEHYYMPPQWYLSNVDRFDSFRREQPKIFVGEYASEGNAMRNALAEAAYLTGIERNADIVDMTCYAPLLAKYDFTQWTKANLIWFTNQQVVKTPNYYVQQLFSENKGDVYLDNQVAMSLDESNLPRYDGHVGVGSWRTAIEIEGVKLNGREIDLAGWESERGDFIARDGRLAQRDSRVEQAVSVSPVEANSDGAADENTDENIVYELRARKTSGDEGFLVVFGHDDEGNYYWWNVGGWDNTRHAIERISGGGGKSQLIETRGAIEEDRWYDLRVELTPGRIRCFLDGQLVHDYREKTPGVLVSPTLDKSRGEVVLKLVNPLPTSVEATVRLHGELALGDVAQLTTIAGPVDAVNTASAEQVRPTQSTIPAGETMRLMLPATSVQALRVKAK